MKKTILLLSLAAIFLAGGTSLTRADYHHDKHGWYDEHNHRHDFIVYHHHHGYWDHQNGVRVFINVD
jgi:hypothetical protein